MEKSKIEWTHNTYNPVRLKTGGFYCAKVSRACTYCYAEIMARRFAAMRGIPYEPYTNRKEFPEMKLMEGMIDGWKFKKRAALNFVSSMTDIFGEFVPDWMIFKILDAEAAAPRQIFQNLTKRHTRALEIVLKWLHLRGISECPENMWFGFTVENQDEADKRLDFLMEIPAKILFVSCEPLLGFLNLEKWLYTRYVMGGGRHMYRQLSWVIAGGESGNNKGTQPMHPDWPKGLLRQCQAADVPFFFKQWGQYGDGSDYTSKHKHYAVLNNGDKVELHNEPPVLRGEVLQAHQWNQLNPVVMRKCGKHLSGALLEGIEYKEFPKYEVLP